MSPNCPFFFPSCHLFPNPKHKLPTEFPTQALAPSEWGEGLPDSFPKWPHFTSPPADVRGSQFLHVITATWLLSVFAIIAILGGVKWYLVLVSMGTSLVADDSRTSLLVLIGYLLERWLLLSFAHF